MSGVSQFKAANLSLEGDIHPSGDWPASLDYISLIWTWMLF